MKRPARLSILGFAAVALTLGANFATAAGDDERQAKIESNATPIDWSVPKVRKLDQPIHTQSPSNAVGTIQYDTGVMTATATVGSLTYGNQFDTALGLPVTANGTVTQVQFYMASVGGTAAFVSMYGPVAGTAASVITSVNVPVAVGFNTLAFSHSYTGPSFLAGVWNNAAPPGGDHLGLDSAGTMSGQGFHGMLINDIVGTGFQTLPGVNAIFRATGNLVVPVELMSFSVDGN